MKKIGVLLLLLLSLSLSLVSCIDNDLPYPIVKGVVTEFEVSGQVSADIDKSKQIINVVLSDTVDIESVYVKKFAVNEGAQSSLDTAMPLDMSKNIYFNISTYQQYDWQIVAKQPVERFVKVENQVGQESVDALNKIVIVYVTPSQDLTNIKILEMKLGASNSMILPRPESIINFTRPQIFLVKQFSQVQEWKMYVFKE